jgi:type IV secretion system protein TrbI
MPSEHDDPTLVPRDTILDRRVKPRGVLPRRLQTWATLIVAAAMLLVIVLTGRSSAPRRNVDATAPATNPSALSPERLRRYQEELARQEARLKQEMAEAQAAALAVTPANNLPSPEQTQPDPLAEERRRREYASLFADTVAFTRRAAGSTTPAASAASRSNPDAALTEALSRAALGLGQPVNPAGGPPASPVPAEQPNSRPPPLATGPSVPPEFPSGFRRLLEGTVIEAVLTNRLEGSFSNPVNALVTTPAYAHERQTVLIPAGARVLGTASPVQTLGETRLAVKFHRLVMPDGATYNLELFPALNERGDAGLKDQVSRHYWQTFGASIAIGSLSGLAQFSTRSGTNTAYGLSDAFGQGMGGSLAASAGRVLDRFLNVLPTVTIREGHRLKIYLTKDLELPPYSEQPAR